MKIPILLLMLLSALVSGDIFNGFYTPEFETYSFEKQSISVVFTLEAPFSVVKQAPLSLSTVLDTSGSLRGLPIQLLKRTTEFLTRKLTDESGFNDLGLVIFDAGVDELTPVVPLVPFNTEKILALIDQIYAEGGTNVAGGLTLGVEQQASTSGGKFKSVYLFSDGLPTVGPTELDEILAILREVLDSSDDIISVSTFGFGNRINLEMLNEIAEVGGGDSFIITEAESIPAAFGKALGGLLSIVATNLEITFSTFPGCHITSITSGGIYTLSSLKVKYSNIYAAEIRDILFEVDLDVGAFGSSKCLQADYDYVDPTTGEKLKGGQLVFEVERAEVVEVVLPAIKVEKSKLRFIIAEAFDSAKEKLLEGDRDEAIKIIAEVEVKVEVSVLIEVSEIKALWEDVKNLKAEIEAKEEALFEEAVKLNQLEVALEKQRSTSPKTMYESEKQVETEEQRKVTDESIRTVLPSLSNGTEENQNNQLSPSPSLTPPSPEVQGNEIDGEKQGGEVAEQRPPVNQVQGNEEENQRQVEQDVGERPSVDQRQDDKEEDQRQVQQDVAERPPLNQVQDRVEGERQQGGENVQQRPPDGNRPRMSVLPQRSNEAQSNGQNNQQRVEVKEDNNQQRVEVKEDNNQQRAEVKEDNNQQRAEVKEDNNQQREQVQRENGEERRQPTRDLVPQRENPGSNSQTQNNNNNDRNREENNERSDDRRSDNDGSARAQNFREQQNQIEDSTTAVQDQQKTETTEFEIPASSQDVQQDVTEQENNRVQKEADSDQVNTQSETPSPSPSTSPSTAPSMFPSVIPEQVVEDRNETDDVFEQFAEQINGTSSDIEGDDYYYPSG